MKAATIQILLDAHLMIQGLYLKRCAIYVGHSEIKKTLSLVFYAEKVFTLFACNYNLKMSLECISLIGNA